MYSYLTQRDPIGDLVAGAILILAVTVAICILAVLGYLIVVPGIAARIAWDYLSSLRARRKERKLLHVIRSGFVR